MPWALGDRIGRPLAHAGVWGRALGLLLGAGRTDERILILQTLAHRPSLFGKNSFQANIC